MSKLATNTQTTSRINSETLPELLRKINALPDAGSGGDEAVIEALNITANGTYNATEAVDGYAPITVNVPIPDGYIQPEGTKTITENGTYDVTEFASAVVEVPTGGGSDDNIDKLIEGTLTEITSNVEKVKNYAFSNCSELEFADFPLATSIGSNAFYICKKLIAGNFPLATSIATRMFDGCSKLEAVNFPLATSIGDYAFQSCFTLTTVDFPLVTKINSSAFQYCDKLTTADFPSATSIGSSAFYQCYGFTTLILRSEKMATLSNKNAFTQCYHFHGTVSGSHNPEGLKDGYIYVPRALVDSYKSASNWSAFETQFRDLESYTVDGTITGELDPNKI